MMSRKRRFPSITSFFTTHKETVDSETEENKTKEDDSDEEATDRSQEPNPRWLNDYSRLKHDSENWEGNVM